MKTASRNFPFSRKKKQYENNVIHRNNDFKKYEKTVKKKEKKNGVGS